MPYTYVANVLIAVNPLQAVPEPNLDSYLNTSMTANPPHPFGTAEFAYRQMILPKAVHRNQAVVISGESGAGTYNYLYTHQPACPPIFLPCKQ
jgi:myosin heavy subunit